MTGPVRVRGIEGLTLGQLTEELKRGGRFVRFPYALSALVVTHRRLSRIYFIRAGQRAARRGWAYAAVSTLLGWWGVPWGPVHTLRCVKSSVRGGFDVTHGMVELLFRSAQPAARPVRPWETVPAAA